MILVTYRHGLRASEVCLEWQQIGARPSPTACTLSQAWHAKRSSYAPIMSHGGATLARSTNISDGAVEALARAAVAYAEPSYPAHQCREPEKHAWLDPGRLS